MEGPPRIVAVISVFNEQDVIGAAIRHLVSQGAQVYLLDDGCTDGTIGIARQFLGRGVVGIEELAAAGPVGTERAFSLSHILQRKEQLAATLEADWFINQDADEFRESPWPHLALGEAVQLVDRLGWNAIDFEVLNFIPEANGDSADAQPWSTSHRYAPARACDRVQVRCWKKQAQQVQLVSTAGHDVLFPDRRVFPIRFPMRHYPIRSEAQGRRKVFLERKGRFDARELASGWHVQYDGVTEGGSLTEGWEPAVEYDRDAIDVTLQIENRLVEEVREDQLRERDRLGAEIARLRDALQRAGEQLLASEASVRRLQDTVDRLVADGVDLTRRLDEVFGSKSWRATAPLRALWRLVGGR